MSVNQDHNKSASKKIVPIDEKSKLIIKDSDSPVYGRVQKK